MFRRIVVATILIWPALALGQSDAIIFGQKIDQLQDLKNGVLLVPLLEEPESSGITMQGNPELMRIREENKARKSAAAKFKFSKILFYPEQLRDSLGVAQKWESMLYDQPESGVDPEKCFVLTVRNQGEAVPKEIVLKKTTKKGTEIKSKVPYWVTYAELSEQVAKETAQLNHDIDSLRAIPDEEFEGKSREKSIKAKQKEIEGLEEYMESRSFYRDYEFFSTESSSFPTLLINRLQPAEYVHNKRKTYYFNFNYLTRLHVEMDTYKRYDEAFTHFGYQLEKELTELLEKQH